MDSDSDRLRQDLCVCVSNEHPAAVVESGPKPHFENQGFGKSQLSRVSWTACLEPEFPPVDSLLCE